jgi:hypothetical protein
MEAHPKGTSHFMEARTGIEPVHGGFADPCVTASPPRRTIIYMESYHTPTSEARLKICIKKPRLAGFLSN